MSESYVDYDSDSKSESSNYKKKKNIDDTEISFDDSSDKSKIINNKDTNKKLLSNIKKLMIDMKNNKNNKDNSKNSRDNRNSREDRNNREDRNSREDRNGGTDNKKLNNIQEMHRLAQQLSKKNNSQQINQQSDNTNYDLTDTISGIINNELNNA